MNFSRCDVFFMKMLKISSKFVQNCIFKRNMVHRCFLIKNNSTVQQNRSSWFFFVLDRKKLIYIIARRIESPRVWDWLQKKKKSAMKYSRKSKLSLLSASSDTRTIYTIYYKMVHLSLETIIYSSHSVTARLRPSDMLTRCEQSDTHTIRSNDHNVCVPTYVHRGVAYGSGRFFGLLRLLFASSFFEQTMTPILSRLKGKWYIVEQYDLACPTMSMQHLIYMNKSKSPSHSLTCWSIATSQRSLDVWTWNLAQWFI